MRLASESVEVVNAALGDLVLELAHGNDELIFSSWRAADLEGHDEVLGHSDQGVFGPTLKPVHSTTRQQAWKLE